MTTAELHSLAADTVMLRDAIRAEQYRTAEQIAANLAEHFGCLVAERNGPRYSTFHQNCKLSSLTGRALYPPRYWQGLALTVGEASEAIGELLLEGGATIKGTEYRRTETSKRKRKAA